MHQQAHRTDGAEYPGQFIDFRHGGLAEKDAFFGEFGFSNIFATYTSEPERFDVVVVHYAPTDKLWVKRIIALPGETIEYKDDKLFINGQYVEESFLDAEYINSQTNNGSIRFTDDFGPFTLGENEYFLCGDNRQVSYDSRRVGTFNKEDIVCKYVYILYPFEEIGVVKNGTK